MINRDYTYDTETMINQFCAGFTHVETGQRWEFEVSDRMDQCHDFVKFVHWLRDTRSRSVGYNNEGFDYPVIHQLLMIYQARGSFTAYDAYLKSQQIIDTPFNRRFDNVVWSNDRIFPQIDLYKINHFDNPARATSLKKLEVNMRSKSVKDLPYSPHVPLTYDQMTENKTYMSHDISETKQFYWHCKDQIDFRDEMLVDFPNIGDVLNFNDTKIGKKLFELKLEESQAGICYDRSSSRKVKRQTIRSRIDMKDVVSDKIVLIHPALQAVKAKLESKVLLPPDFENIGKDTKFDENGSPVVETKGVFKDINATIGDFKFVFGTGGLHGSLKGKTVRAGNSMRLIDIDVASYYPSLAIANRWYPQHLSELFCDINAWLFEERKRVGKKTTRGEAYKLAMNGVYGDSNNIYSPFYDPQYTMKITVNGQLFLCMLAEQLLMLPDTQIVQANTDGLTMLVPEHEHENFVSVCENWEQYTGLDLEHNDYSSMHIRDVNNYIAVGIDGKIKRIGAYAYKTVLEDPTSRERGWHQNHNCLVVRKAAEANILHGKDIAEFIFDHADPFDFMLSTKVARSSKLMWGDQQVQNICRYYISTGGQNMTKIMPPIEPDTSLTQQQVGQQLNAAIEQQKLIPRGDVAMYAAQILAVKNLARKKERHFAIQKGWRTSICNDTDDFKFDDMNWYYYIKEAKKLTNAIDR